MALSLPFFAILFWVVGRMEYGFGLPFKYLPKGGDTSLLNYDDDNESMLYLYVFLSTVRIFLSFLTLPLILGINWRSRRC